MTSVTPPASGRRRLRPFRIVLLALLAAYLSVGAWHLFKPLPEGLNSATPFRPVTDIEFLSDATWSDESGATASRQEIFDAAFAMIGRARSLIVADFFLVNAFAGESGQGHRPLSHDLVAAMMTRQAEASLQAMLITDPFNTLYEGVEQPLFDRLESSGVAVVDTDLRRLRDSNPLWSAAWRICCQWLGNSASGGWLPNPVGETPVTLRTWLALFNFKANHRKTLVVDTDSGWEALVTSGNPHDASSRHHNIAIRFQGAAALDLLETELSVAGFSGGVPIDIETAAIEPTADWDTGIRILTESRIREAALAMMAGAQPGDRLDLLMFYLSHRGIIDGLIDAHRRGVEVRVLLDPNRDAFGREKDGVPNRPAAMDLHRAGIPVRWCNTQGEQCHAKMLLRRGAEGRGLLLAGSANFTRRNLDNFNLETDVQVRAPKEAPVIRDAGRFFDSRWHNEAGKVHSLPYSAFADHSRWRYWRYRFMEATGLSTF